LTGLFHTCYRKIWQISLIWNLHPASPPSIIAKTCIISSSNMKPFGCTTNYCHKKEPL
jgi:hypothetical protein